MTENERMAAIKSVKSQLEFGYLDLGCHDEDELNIIKQAMTALGAIGQYKWELNVAVSQLKDLGFQFGQNTKGYVCITQEEYEQLLEYKAMYKDLCK